MSIAVANLTTGADTDGGTSSTTASISPAANALILVSIDQRTGITADPNQPTLSGNGLTWELVGTIVYDTTSSSRKRVSLFRSMGAAPSAGAITIDFGGQANTDVHWTVESVTGVDTSGSNGANAIVQSATNKDETGTASSLSVTLAAFNNVNNATFGAFGLSTETGYAVGSGFTLGGTANTFSGSARIISEYKLSNDTGVDITMTGSLVGGVACELRADNVFKDAVANSGVKASVSNYSWNHTVGAFNNRMLLVGVECRDNDNPTNRPVTGITANGVAMTLITSRSMTDGDGDDTRVEIWGILAPGTGVISISVTHTGTVDHAGAHSLSLGNAEQSLTANATGFDEDTQSSATTNPDISMTTTKNNCMMFDCCYHQDGADLTVGANQTSIAQLGTNGGGDRAISSYEFLPTAGAGSMTWTAATMDAFVQVAVAIASYSAAAATSVKDLIGIGILPFAR